MFITDRLIYLQLQKTGCSHTKKLLRSVCKGGITYGKHNSIYEVPKNLLGDLSTKTIIGNVRNPWDWYVSLWAFGCMSRGKLDHRLTSGFLKKLRYPSRLFISSKQWKSVYSDSDNPDLFRQWLKMLYSRETRRDIGEGFGKSKVGEFCGLMTYRYLRLYDYDFEKEKNNINNYEELIFFDNKKNMLNMVLRTEHLEEDFKTLMLKIDIPLSEIQTVLNLPKTNTSKRQNYHNYYNEETKELVAQRDKLIIEKYNYSY